MDDTRSTNARELAEHVTRYARGSRPVVVSNRGRVIGVFIPLKRDEEARQRAIDKLDQTVRQLLCATGMSEEELVTLLGLR
jgi:antitoxin (DNA-binding transcriptional repressor) of toxin-antitoxin stability system